MKTFCIILTCILCFLIFFSACIVNIIWASPEVCVSEPSILKLRGSCSFGGHETGVRVVPSLGDYSLVS